MDIEPPAETRPAEAPAEGAPADDEPTRSPQGLALRMPSTSRLEPITPPQRWYGWQTLLADAAGVALLAGATGLAYGTSIDTQTKYYAFVPGAVALGLGAPVLHARHGAIDRAAASGLARMLGVPVLMAGTWLFGASQNRCNSSPLTPIACPPGSEEGSRLETPLLVGGIALAGISALDAIFAWSAPPPPAPSIVRVGIR